MSSLVALTGASGFIGQEILKCLVKDGYQVRALVRKPRISTDDIEWIHGDLNNKDALGRLVKDASAIIHCAGAVKGRSLESFVAPNVTGTINLIAAAAAQNSKPRFLLISSLAAKQPELSWYAKSKKMAEQSVIESADKIKWTIFRPTAVYGPNDTELKPLFKATKHGILPVVGELTNSFSLLHVDDFVTSIQCWLSSEVPINGVFELGDGKLGGYNYQSLASLTQEVWGRPVRCLKIPTSLIYAIANTNVVLAKYLHYAPMLTPGKIREFQHPDWVCDNAPIIRALPGWKPQMELRKALPLIFS